jgi:chloramphenicol-sensitive protein RarD
MNIRSSPLALAFFAYGCWGFFPAYWKQIPQFSSYELMAWRVILSLFSLIPLLAWRREFPTLLKLMIKPGSFFGLLGTALIIGFNWSLYIWAVTNGHIVESSLGYFLNPLMNLAIGALVLKEKLNPPQKLAFLLASLGVAWLTYTAGAPPWIALLLALSFTLYGLGRKFLHLPTLPATTAETFFLAPAAAAALFYLATGPTGLHAGVASSGELFWLALAGLVTAIPLLAFAAAAVALPLTVLGFTQFISPSLQFLLGVVVYKEPFSQTRAFGFFLIWSGLAFFLGDLARRARA